MKTVKRVLLALVVLAVSGIFFTGCLSTAVAGSSSSKTKKSSGSTSTSSSSAASTSSSANALTFKLYDNCPENTYALAAELALQATMKGYKGVTKLTVKGTPSTPEAETVLKYYGFCYGIKTAIEKGTGKTVTLTFNTSKDGKGTNLDFTDAASVAKSLLLMTLANKTSVYAIYKY